MGTEGAAPSGAIARASVSLFCLLVVGLGAVSYRDARHPPMTVEILQMRDPQRIGKVMQVDIRLVNRSSVDITPVFAVPSATAVQPIEWRIVAGPTHVRPGATVVETLEAPVEAAAPLGENLVVIVRDAGLRVFASSAPAIARVADPVAVANPAFERWAFSASDGDVEPAGWVVAGLGSTRLGPHLRVRRATVAGRQALVLHLGRPPAGRWRGLSVQQYLREPERVHALFDRALTLSVYPTLSYTAGYGPRSVAKPGTAFGLMVYADGRWLWIVYSDVGTGWYVEPDAAVVVVRAPLHTWTVDRVDFSAIYRRLDWPLPQELIFGLFAVTDRADLGGRDPAIGLL